MYLVLGEEKYQHRYVNPIEHLEDPDTMSCSKDHSKGRGIPISHSAPHSLPRGLETSDGLNKCQNWFLKLYFELSNSAVRRNCSLEPRYDGYLNSQF